MEEENEPGKIFLTPDEILGHLNKEFPHYTKYSSFLKFILLVMKFGEKIY